MAIFFADPAPGTHDGFDVVAQYQMIPAGGVRRMALWVQADEAEDVIVYSADPNKAYLFGLYTIEGAAAVRGSGFFVRRNSAIRFLIGGRDPGPTQVIVETVRGAPRGFLLLSVKPQLRLTYQLAVLSDRIHVPAKSLVGENLAANMLGAAKIWVEQANVSLERVGEINDVVVPGDLGDPLIMDEVKLDAIYRAMFTKQLCRAHLYIYCTWDVYLGATNVGGFNTGQYCFIENGWGRSKAGEVVCAHEIGHALGLPHSTDGNLVMTPTGFPQNDFLDMLDIETANRL